MVFRFGRSKKINKRAPSGPDGKRVYAIGDVHGCYDELVTLCALIREDIAARPGRETSVVMLGDLIDRGPNSRGVIEFLTSNPFSPATMLTIRGNHEDILLKGLDGTPSLLKDWLQYGGTLCASSYGIPAHTLSSMTAEQLEYTLLSKIPARHINFLRSSVDCIRFGDFFLVHAGVRPGIPLHKQAPQDLKWIRDDFLSSTANHGAVIVHGHSIVSEPTFLPNRIAIDTGAYQTGRLTALCIEGEATMVLQT
ncbi:MAG: metallophosphoesterase family protein [Pseudomonadota bacterium]